MYKVYVEDPGYPAVFVDQFETAEEAKEYINTKVDDWKYFIAKEKND